MPSNTNPKASNVNANYDNYRWVPGKNARFDAVCIRVDRDAGRVSLGIKGWDSRHKAPGFIIVDLGATALQDLAGLCGAAIQTALAGAAKERAEELGLSPPTAAQASGPEAAPVAA